MTMDLVTSAGGDLDLDAELDETKKALREVTLMIEQSQGEVLKLSQRNAAITTHLQQVQNQFERVPIQDIRNAYDSALDAQQRLFVMRGQLEKLQSEKSHLERFRSALERARRAARARCRCLRPLCPLPWAREDRWQVWRCWSTRRKPSASGFRGRCTMGRLRLFPISSFKQRLQCD